jgi:hypothetical protein
MSIYICTICEQQKDSDFNCADLDGKECCEECFEQLEELQEEVERYKLLWETSSEGARVIIAEQEEEIKQLKEKLNDK